MRALLLAILSLAATFAHATSGFSFSEKPGEFAVGFKVVQQYDETRTFLGRVDPVTGKPVTINRARPIQTLIWYPAAENGKRMRYGDYLALTGSEDRFDRSDEQINVVAESRLRDYVPPEMNAPTVAEIKEQSMWATQGASAVVRKFPVVVYAPSHNASAAENADMCEYLASHGYVVLASPSMGASSRWMMSDLADVEAQVGDIEFLVGYAATLVNADSSHLAVIGYSWGGISNVFAAAKDSRITALVGFDGGIRLVGKLVAAAKYVTPDRITVPYLYLASNSGSFEDLYRQKQDLSDDLLARLKYSDLYMVTLNPLVHYHFASEHLRFLSTHDPVVFPGEYSLQEIFQAYGWIARYTLAFLDSVLKNDSRALAFVTNTPTANGFPAHAVKVEVNRSTGLPPTRESLAAEIYRKGFSHADEVYADMKKRDPDFTLPPYEFADWIDDLLALDRKDDALQIGKLFAKTYADRPGPFERLGGLYLANGDKALARENFKRALAIDPSNERVKGKLKDLDVPH